MKNYKKYVNVECRDCKVIYSKRFDSLTVWFGRCKTCTLIEINKRPETKEARIRNGKNVTALYGGIPNSYKFPKGNIPHNKGKRHLGGEKHWNWKGGISPERNKIRSSFEYAQWRRGVYMRDRYTCTICGDNKGHNLNADHIMPFALHPELRFEISNGRTLCTFCHKQYGAKVSSRGELISEAIYPNNTAWNVG
jgi:hypothetical protein